MCFTIAIHASREEIEKRFDARFDDPTVFLPGYYFSAFTFPAVPVITGKDNHRIRMYRWGLIPSWTKDEQYAEGIRTKTFNAKAETVTEKPSFRNVVKTNRCLVVSKGFFEWQKRENEKIPYYIGLGDDQIFAFAGLYDTWIHPVTGEINETFTIITTTANPLLAFIHNTKQRMPVILPKENEQDWINTGNPLDKALELLVPYDQEKMKSYTISKLVSIPGAKKNVPEVLKPFSYENKGL
jgi:putative SOS response-associated peptidase YedK